MYRASREKEMILRDREKMPVYKTRGDAAVVRQAEPSVGYQHCSAVLIARSKRRL